MRTGRGTPPPAFPFLHFQLVKERKRRSLYQLDKAGIRDNEALHRLPGQRREAEIERMPFKGAKASPPRNEAELTTTSSRCQPVRRKNFMNPDSARQHTDNNRVFFEVVMWIRIRRTGNRGAYRRHGRYRREHHGRLRPRPATLLPWI